MARARHEWLTAGAEDPRNAHPAVASTPTHFYDTAAGVLNSSGSLGNLQLQVHSCVAGQHRGFFGATILDREQPGLAINVVLPEDGTDHITVNTPLRPPHVIPKNHCRVWDVDLHEDGTVANEIYELAGHAKFDCHEPDTDVHLAGDLILKRCH